MRWRSVAVWLLAGLLAAPWGCGGGDDDGDSGTVTQRIEPCWGAPPPTPTGSPVPTTTPAILWPVFDVWNAEVDPDGRSELVVSVNTINAADAAEFRLTVACQGMLMAETIGGMPCTFPPPSRQVDVVPECPHLSIDLGSLNALRRVTCLLEIGPTEPLDIGTGLCANPSRAQYRLTVTLNGQRQRLTMAAHDCSAPESCLETFFAINVDATPTATVVPTPTATPVPD